MKIVWNRKELAVKDNINKSSKLLKRESTFSNMDMFYKSLDEDNLDY